MLSFAELYNIFGDIAYVLHEYYVWAYLIDFRKLHSVKYCKVIYQINNDLHYFRRAIDAFCTPGAHNVIQSTRIRKHNGKWMLAIVGVKGLFS